MLFSTSSRMSSVCVSPFSPLYLCLLLCSLPILPSSLSFAVLLPMLSIPRYLCYSFLSSLSPYAMLYPPFPILLPMPPFYALSYAPFLPMFLPMLSLSLCSSYAPSYASFLCSFLCSLSLSHAPSYAPSYALSYALSLSLCSLPILLFPMLSPSYAPSYALSLSLSLSLSAAPYADSPQESSPCAAENAGALSAPSRSCLSRDRGRTLRRWSGVATASHCPPLSHAAAPPSICAA